MDERISYSDYYVERVKAGEPGCIGLLYDAVIEELEQGLIPSAGTMLLLLEKLQRPKYTDRNHEQLEALKYIEGLQRFEDIDSDEKPGSSFRNAVATYIKFIEKKQTPANSFEREVKANENDGGEVDRICKMLEAVKRRNP